MSAIMVNETMGKMVALHEFAMENAEVCELVKNASTVEALNKLLENFEFIPCTTKVELGRARWDEFLAAQEFLMKNMPSDFRTFEPFIDYAAYGESCYKDIKEEHELVYWSSTGVIFNLD